MVAAVVDARQALLEKCMECVAGRGLSDLSLRELAAAIGTSHRMLLYHFGSREGLIAAIVAAMESHQRGLLAGIDAESPAELVRRHWDALTAPDLAPFERLFFEVLSHAFHQRPGTEGFLETLTEPWMALGTRRGQAFGEPVSRAEMLLGIAVIRGLLLEVLAGTDIETATEALHAFLAMWDAARSRS